MDGLNTDAGASPASAYEMSVPAETSSMPGLVGFLAQGGGFESSMMAILVTIILLTVFSAVNIRMKSRKGVSEQ